MGLHSRAPKKNTSQGNEVLPQRTIRLIQGPCYQQGSPRQDPAGNRTTRRPPDHRKEKQTAVVWTCLPFIRSDQNHRLSHSERRKKTRQTEEEVGRQHQGMDSPGVHQIPEDWRTEKYGGNWLRNVLDTSLVHSRTRKVGLGWWWRWGFGRRRRQRGPVALTPDSGSRG